MTPEQISKFLDLIEIIANRQYTIAGAADWPVLATVGGGLVVLLCTILGFMWRDLRAIMRDNRIDGITGLKENKTEWKDEANKIWKAFSDCQNDCCPRNKDK